MKRGFTLIEMLVVIGIIAALIAASLGGYSFATKRAQKARGRELVSNVATALNVLYQRQNRWPTPLVEESAGDGRLTAKAAYVLAKYEEKENDADNLPVENRPRGELAMTYDIHSMELKGLDRCGIVTPWAMEKLRRLPAGDAGLGASVPSGGTVQDHQLHFAIDTEGRGFVQARVKGKTVKIRGTVAVWCWGMNGVEDDYEGSMAGRGKCDDIYSWTKAQEVR